MGYNIFGLKSMLTKEHVVAILEGIGAHGVNPRDPNGIRSSCPIHKSKGASVFVYNVDLQTYNCYGECEDKYKAGDVVAMVQAAENCSFDDAVKLICEYSGLDIKLIEDSSDWLLEELKNKIDHICKEMIDNQENILFGGWEYGVQPIEESLAKSFIGQKDESGFIDRLGFKAPTLTLFESGYEPREKRWLLPIRSPDGLLLGFDGRDITNTKKDKWKKRAGLLTSKIIGRLDITKQYILDKDEIIIVEGKKDMMATFEAGLQNVSCIYGSALSDHQLTIIQSLCSEIVIFPDGDTASYKMVRSIMNKAYPEFSITIMETPDGEDPADLTTAFINELYNNKISAEEWLEKYKYRAKKQKNK
jgi:DNA primase